MGRSPLFARVQASWNLAARAEASHVSIDEVADRLLSRRDFLRGSAAVVGGLALSACSPRRDSTARIVIVGAGLAGLTCAYRLQQAGFASQVIEASSRVGGRMLTLRNGFPDGQRVELGAEFVDSDNRAIKRIIDEMGLSLTDTAAASAGAQEIFYFDGQRISARSLAEDLRPAAAAVKRDLDELDDDYVLYNAHNGGAELDRMSISQWLESRDITGRARALLEVTYTGEYGLDAGDQSALNMLFSLSEDLSDLGENSYEDPAGPGSGGDERFVVTEGTDAITTRLAESLETPVRLDTVVEAIRHNGAGFHIEVLEGGVSKTVSADVLVVAIPFSVLRNVKLEVDLPPTKRKAIAELGYGTNAKLITGFASRIWQPHSGVSYSDLPYQTTWEPSLGQPGDHGILTDFLGGSEGIRVGLGTTAERASDFISQIDRVYPRASDAFTRTSYRQHWPSEPFALGSYTCYRPGQFTSIAGSEGEAVGNLHFAGEHTNLEYQGDMNGAAESGNRAAREVIASL